LPEINTRVPMSNLWPFIVPRAECLEKAARTA
jgi:hypothetical protein